MRRRGFLALGGLLGLALLGLAPALSAQDDEPGWRWSGVERVVAVGDVHGAYDNFVRILQNAGVVDDDLDWIGGRAHLVQTGDMVDRGPDSRKVMDLLMELQEDAEKQGGMVHVLIGNHEAMNVVGILDLVSDEEFESYVDRDSRRRREATFERYYEQLRQEAREKGEELGGRNTLWREFQEKYPLGYIEHRQAFSADGAYGAWIRRLNVAVEIDDVVFSHGDWSERFSQLGIEEVNRRIRQELRGEAPLENGLAFDAESPLQYRGLAHTTLTQAAQAAERDKVVRILQNLEAKTMVVGHTITSGVIESRFDGGHVSIDTGMLEIYRGGHRVALEIEGNELRAVHDGGKVTIPKTMNETNFDDYVRAVAAVDPANVDVQLKLADILREEGETAEAVAIVESSMEDSDYVPFRYHDFLGTYYQEKGDPGLARRHYLAYIEGLKELVEASPENLNLANLLARFCIDKGLELDVAEQALDRILEEAPENASFQMTRARFLIAKDEYRRALEVIGTLPASDGMAYDVHYLEGLAYLGLDEPERAREALEAAVRESPERKEAREELRKLEGPVPK